MNHLFEPLNIGEIFIKNRIIMAPMTRCRASEDAMPNELMAEYYAQRASAGLIITEGTIIAENAGGYSNTPGIWNDKQVSAWKVITDAVHAKGGKIICQLWHPGRASHPMFLNGELPVAPSAIAIDGYLPLERPKQKYVAPRALTVPEIQNIVADFKKAAENAKKAGFDGVEPHGANGYLLDQFLQDNSNKRTDEYGGSIENRAKFALQVIDVLIAVFGAGRVGFHASPNTEYNAMNDSNLLETFSYLTQELSKRKIAFLFLRESKGLQDIVPKLRKLFDGILIVNQGLTPENAQQIIANNQANAVSFGKLFIEYPDLVERIKKKLPVRTNANPADYYVGGEKGYIDYPNYQAEQIG